VLPNDVGEPNQRDHEVTAARSIEQLAIAAGGRTLALFTSHEALRRTAELCRERLEEAGIGVMVQGADGSPRQLTDNLLANPSAVIFGTSSFWEGVDIPGDALSLVVIDRLPFGVPSDPIHRSRSEQYDRPFDEYSLPAAILRFRQGFGRLIRTRTDRGVVAVLDGRISTKRYGERFLDAVPPCTVARGSSKELADRVRAWLGQ
jgi:DNA polymerase-3 subunit epsilon/ATP-dependent DNA helicase DinG